MRANLAALRIEIIIIALISAIAAYPSCQQGHLDRTLTYTSGFIPFHIAADRTLQTLSTLVFIVPEAWRACAICTHYWHIERTLASVGHK